MTTATAQIRGHHMNLPATFTRAQIVAAFDALDLDDDLIAAVEMSGAQVAVQMFIPDGDGVMHMLGENATVTVVIPIDDEATT